MSKIEEGQHGEPWSADDYRIQDSTGDDLRVSNPYWSDRAVDCVNFCDGRDLSESVIVSKAELEALRGLHYRVLRLQATGWLAPMETYHVKDALAKLDAARKVGE